MPRVRAKRLFPVTLSPESLATALDTLTHDAQAALPTLQESYKAHGHNLVQVGSSDRFDVVSQTGMTERSRLSFREACEWRDNGFKS